MSSVTNAIRHKLAPDDFKQNLLKKLTVEENVRLTGRFTKRIEKKS